MSISTFYDPASRNGRDQSLMMLPLSLSRELASLDALIADPSSLYSTIQSLNKHPRAFPDSLSSRQLSTDLGSLSAYGLHGLSLSSVKLEPSSILVAAKSKEGAGKSDWNSMFVNALSRPQLTRQDSERQQEPIAAKSNSGNMTDWNCNQSIDKQPHPFPSSISSRQSSTGLGIFSAFSFEGLSLSSVKLEPSILAAKSKEGAGKTDWNSMFVNALSRPQPTRQDYERQQEPIGAKSNSDNKTDWNSNQSIDKQLHPFPSSVSSSLSSTDLGSPSDFSLEGLPLSSVKLEQPVAAKSTKSGNKTDGNYMCSNKKLSGFQPTRQGSECQQQPKARVIASSIKSQRKQRKIIPKTKEYIDDYTESDVLFGRGGRSNHHPGNKNYRLLIVEFQPTYQDCSDKREKTMIAQNIVDCVNQEHKGRFLEMDKSADRWYVVTNTVARTKVGQALRDNNSPEARAIRRERYGC